MKGNKRPKKHNPGPKMQPVPEPAPAPHKEPCGVCDSFYHCKHCAHSKLSYKYV
jgi:hypothetical protein